MRKLGPEATFQGTMQWKLARDRWSLDLGGSHLTSIDLSELTQGMVNRMTGDASVSLERCRIEPGSQLDLSGKLLAGSGFVSQALIQSLRSEMDFDVAPAIEGDIRDWPYEQFAIRFDLFGPDMKLEGICEQQRGLEHLPAGTVFTINGSGFCASKPLRRSWVGLIRALWPEKGESLPVSTQTAWLFELLPAPNPTISPNQDSQQPVPRITSASELQGVPSISQP